MSADTQATLLLVAGFGRDGQVAPLNRREYSVLADSLRRSALRPADLLDPGALGKIELAHKSVTPARIEALLDRRSAAGLALEQWANKGIWVVSRGDPEYPRAIKKRLRGDAPPVFFGIGARSLVQRECVCVVGSRELDSPGKAFAEAVAEAAVKQGLQVVSGAARGADEAAMVAVIENGGHALGIPAEALEREAQSKRWRAAIRDQSLTLMSPVEPHVAFSVGRAMERNKYLYAQSVCAVVVASGDGEGGTWAGAVEALKHRWVPVCVRSDTEAPEGNRKLLRAGAMPIDLHQLRSGFAFRAVGGASAAETDMAAGGSSDLQLNLDALVSHDAVDASVSAPAASNAEYEAPERDRFIGEAQPAVPFSGPANGDVFEMVWPQLHVLLRRPQSMKQLKESLSNVLDSQLKAWLNEAVRRELVTKRGRPAKYLRKT